MSEAEPTTPPLRRILEITATARPAELVAPGEIEIVFSIPGLGKLIVDAISVKNVPVVQDGILFIAVAMSFINLITDIIYAMVDPRIRPQYMKPKKRKSSRRRRCKMPN